MADLALRFDVLTLFPEMIRAPLEHSILRRGVDAGLLAIQVHDIRAFTADRHHVVDDAPFGGGAGMVMKAPPIFDAVDFARAEATAAGLAATPEVILLTPTGRRFGQSLAEDLATRRHLILICGHYEGVDERVSEHLVTREISIGDYILTGGELAALVLVDAVSRLIPGVLGTPESLAEESISSGLLEYPHYTRPADFRGWTVPDVLLSGDHQAVGRWRRAEALRRTYERRPDLLARAPLVASDAEILDRLAMHPTRDISMAKRPADG